MTGSAFGVAPAAAGILVQRVSTQTGTSTTGTTGLPLDDTIPQNTEGDQFMSLAITPQNTTNVLEIRVQVFGSDSAGGSYNAFIVALFQDSTANALAAMVGGTSPFAASPGVCTFTYIMTAGTTSSTTFKVRAGDPTGTFTFNGASGTRLFGGVICSGIQITEYIM